MKVGYYDHLNEDSPIKLPLDVDGIAAAAFIIGGAI